MKKIILNLSKNPFIQGGALFIISNLLISVINYFFNITIGRELGPSGYGEINALFSYITILSVPITVVTNILIQKIGAQGDNGKLYSYSVEQWVIAKTKRWWFLFLIVCITIPFMPAITSLSPLVAYSLVPLQILSILAAFYDGALQGLQMFWWFAVINLLAAIVKLFGTFFPLGDVIQIEIIIFFLLLSGLLKLILSKKFFDKDRKVDTASLAKIDKRIIHIFNEKQFWFTTCSILSITLLNNIDIIFAKKFLSAYDAGLYSSWNIFAKIIFYLISPLLTVSFIFFTNKKQEQHHQKVVLFSLVTLILTCIGSYIAYTYFASLIIDLFFGAKFMKVIPYLSSASIFGIMYILIAYFNNYYLAKRSGYAILLILAIPLYLALLFIFQRTINGIIQANIVFSSIIVFFYVVVYFLELMKTKSPVRN